MTRHRHRPRLLSALAAAALSFAVVSAGGWSTGSSAIASPELSANTASTPDGLVSVEVSPSDGGAVEPSSLTSFGITLTNGTDADLPAGSVSVAVTTARITGTAALDAWLDTTGADAAATPAGTTVVRTIDIPELIAGQQYVVSGLDFTPPALGFDDTDAWGSYGVSAGYVAGDTAAGGRTALVWRAQGQPTSATVALVAPLTAPLSYGGLLDADELTELTADDGALTTQLDALFGEQIALGIDPRIIASVRALGTRAPESAVAWLARLEAAPNETFALQYGDAEPAVQAEAGLDRLLTPSSFSFALNVADFPVVQPTETPTPTGSPTTRPDDVQPTPQAGSSTTTSSDPSAAATPSEEPTPTPSPSETPGQAVPTVPTMDELLSWSYSLPSIVWAGGAVTDADLAVFAASGGTVTMLDSANTTDTGQTVRASATIGASQTLLADHGLAESLGGAAAATTDAAFESAIADVNARAAAIGTEGSSGGTVVAVLPRGVDATLPALGETVNALRSLPATTQTSLAATLAEPPAAATLGAMTPDSERVSDVQVLLDEEQDVTAFSSVLDEPELLTGRERATLLSSLAAGWLRAEDAWGSAVTAQQERTDTVLASVRVTDSSRINMVGGEVSLPFAVRNDLPYPVTVVMEASPSNGRLSISGSVTQEIAADSRATVLIPVQSQIGNGDVTLRLQLFSTSGQAIGDQSFVGVNVRADWEGIGAVVLALLVALLFVSGVVRMVLSRRAKRRASGGTSAASAAAPDSGQPPGDEPPVESSPGRQETNG
ncbi:hypothetical protein HOW07_07975 [Plantibacter sp. MCCC 1A11337]|uniref:DUF6049 family protein n=1 Tax=Plantibacter sp. MCCC 1A11337 TaxID=2736644 RepID=UPI001582C783|nr:DUF6049 family protein [Plantibacter sp. MCCC 1A11337]NUJ87944.1 hypothetical protein [Plantibacter sp. MCCC 1A11337]